MPGQMVHVEIPAGDTSKAREFWGSLFGWEWQTMEGSPTEYHMTRFSENTGGAIYEPDPANKRGPRVYFDVDDINAATARVGDLGGEAGEPMPVPGMGWFSVNKDTEGNEFGLWQNDPEASAPTA
jgi:predicted enzyme related to lactoylglutathione lyase